MCGMEPIADRHARFTKKSAAVDQLIAVCTIARGGELSYIDAGLWCGC